MTQVFFYHSAADRLAVAAGLIRKAFLQRKALLVYVPDGELADALDRRLWLVPPEDFLPHVAVDSPLAAETPVLLARRLDAMPQDERLMNLGDDVPPAFSRFASVIEVAGAGEQERLAGRRRARFYKDRGYAIRYFDSSGQR